MEPKTIFYLLTVSLCLFALCLGNQEQSDQTTTTRAKAAEPTQPVSPATTVQANANSPLSSLQVEACNSADRGGTCITKLKDFGIVSLEDCCKYLGKCC